MDKLKLTYDPSVHGNVNTSSPDLYSYVKPIQVKDDSQYDKGFTLPTQGANPYDALYEHRAQTQPGVDQLANGIFKGLSLAGTTFADTFGGTMVGLINAASTIGTDKSALNAFVNNPFSNAMQDWNDSMEKNFANYRTKEEQEAGLLSQMTTANFWGDTFIKNLGFAAGAMVSGNLVSSAFSSLGKAALISKRAGVLDDAAKILVSEGKASTIEAARDLTVKALFEGDDAIKTLLKDNAAKLIEGIGKDAKSIKNWNLANQVTSSTLASVGEARLEALGNANQYEQKRLSELQQEYGNNIPQEELDKLNKEKASFQNVEFLTNAALLSLSNFTGYRDIYARNYDLNTKGISKLIKESAFGVTSASKNKWYETLGKSLLHSSREGLEELSQTAIQFGTENWVKAKHYNDITVDNFLNDMSEGVGQSLGKEGLESFVIGTLTGLLGVPGYKASNKLKIGLNGGIIEDFANARSENERAQQASDKINSAFQEFLKEHKDSPDNIFPIFKDMIARATSYDEAQKEALRTGDRHTYEWLKSEKMFNLMHAYVQAGKVDNFKKGLEDETNLSATDIRNKYATPNAKDPNVKDDFFLNKDDKEVKEYIRDKSNKAKDAIDSLLKIEDELETKFGQQFALLGDKTKVPIKTLLARNLYLGKDLDKRIETMHRQLVSKILFKDFKFTNDELNNILLTDDSINLEKIITENPSIFKELSQALLKEYNNKKISASDKKDIEDYVSLLGDRIAHNRAYIQLTDNDFSKAIEALNEAESKAEKEKQEQVKKEQTLDEYIADLTEQARQGGYNDEGVYYPNTDKAIDKHGLFLSGLFINHNGVLKKTEFRQGKYVLVNPISNNTLLDANNVPEEWNKDFIEKNKGKITIVDGREGLAKMNNHKIVRENTTKLAALELMLNRLTNQVQAQLNKLKNSELLRDKIQDKLDELQAIEAANGIVNRKQFEKRLNNLKQLLTKVNTEIDNINNLLTELKDYESLMLNFQQGLTESLAEIKNYSFNEKLEEYSKEYKEEIKALESFLDKDFTSNIEEAYKELEAYREDLEDRKGLLERLIQSHEEKLKTNDLLSKIILKNTNNAIFKSKYPGIPNTLLVTANNNAIIKFTKQTKYALNKIAEKEGITLNELLDRLSEDINNLADNKEDVFEATKISNNLKSYISLYNWELQEINKKLNDIQEIFGTNLNERKNEYISLEKRLDKIDRLVKDIRTVQAQIIRAEYNRIKTEESQKNKEVDNGINVDNYDAAFESVSRPENLFRTTNRVELYDQDEKAKSDRLVTIYDDQGYPLLNPAESSLIYNQFLQDNFTNLNSDKPNNQVRVFKLNDSNTPKDLNDVALETIKINNPNYIPARDYIVVITDNTGEPIKQDGKYVYTFLPTKDNAVSNTAPAGKVLNYLKVVGKQQDVDIADVRGYRKNNAKLEVNGKFYAFNEVLELATEFAEKSYDDFLNKIDANLNNGVLLEINSVSNGHLVKQRESKEDNPDQPFKYQNPIPILTKKVKDFNVNNLKIEVANANNTIGTRTIPAGYAVLTLPSGAMVPIRGRKLNKNEIDTILHLISMSDVETTKGVYGLKNLRVKLPEEKTENGKNSIPVFGYTDQEKNTNVISRLIYWGKNEKSNNEVYIDKGKVVYKVLTSDGVYKYQTIDVSDVLNPALNKDFVFWLSQRHLNINRALASKSEKLIYFHPVFKDGEVTFEFRNGYTNYILENDMIESNLVDNKNPNTKNIIYSNIRINFAQDNSGLPSIKNLPSKPSNSTTPVPTSAVQVDLGSLLDESKRINPTDYDVDEVIDVNTTEKVRSDEVMDRSSEAPINTEGNISENANPISDFIQDEKLEVNPVKKAEDLTEVEKVVEECVTGEVQSTTPIVKKERVRKNKINTGK